ncbi:MAG: amidohydrolase, partial [Vicinamibacterales bacterium]
PSRQLLDSVVSDRPALMFDADGRAVWVNTKALRAAGITRRTPDPPEGSIVLDPRSGEPAGVLQGSAGALVAKLIPVASEAQRAAALRHAIVRANALGITSVQNTDDSVDAFELYDSLRRSGDLTVRIYSAIPVSRPLTEGNLARLDEIRQKYPDDPLFKAGALSIRLDGTIAERTAALLEPYESDTAPDGDAGETSFGPDDLNRSVRLADAAGWQIITQATGDRAVRAALNAYAHAARSNRPPARGRRHRIENLALVDAADLHRFEPLGVVASMQPSRGQPTPQRVEMLSRQLGRERSERAFALGSVSEATRLVLGSAWPAGALDPLLGLHVATTSDAPDGVDDRGAAGAERVTLKNAIAAYTSSAAWASFDEQRKGSISAGMLADMVVLSEDIFETRTPRLTSVSVAVTIFDGKIVYRRDPRSETEPVPSLQD